MPSLHSARALVASFLLAGAAAACSGGGIEGKYYNTSTGAFAFELKDGQVLNADGTPGPLPMVYTIRGDSVFLAPPGIPAGEALALAIKGNGILDTEAGSLRKQ
ncbi:MAG TPA: hypothetical protein VJ817_09755 [Gemmatimonadales bacterium]|nr:hypothetical protein [Gemmatimonadales bacterium]